MEFQDILSINVITELVGKCSLPDSPYVTRIPPFLFSCSMANKNSTLRCTFSAPSHSATLLQGLSILRSQGQLLDVVLAINEERFQVHKAVLAACSDYFR